MNTSLKTALCMPVGPRGVLGPTAQLLCAIAAKGIASPILIATGHLCRARNTLIAAAVDQSADRVLWLDSDVWADSTTDLCDFIARSEAAFAASPRLAWSAAGCVMRGTSAVNYRIVDVTGEEPVLWAGLGLQYWHVPRYIAAGEPQFRWIEPLSEDYRMCDDLFRAGYHGRIDRHMATMHDGMRWPGASDIGKEQM